MQPKEAIVFRADMVVLRDGKPIAVIEAKRHPVRPPFQEPVVRELSEYSTSVNSPWMVLVDPEKTQFFRSGEMTRPIATLSTGEIVEQETPSRPDVIGERTLLFAVDRWLHGLPQRTQFVSRHPELRDFALDISNHITTERDWWPGQSGDG